MHKSAARYHCTVCLAVVHTSKASHASSLFYNDAFLSFLEQLTTDFCYPHALAGLSLPALCVLDLSFNMLVSLPEDMGLQLPALQQLYLCNNMLVSLPASLSSCPIIELLASENGFKEVPEVVTALPQLAKLSLGACRLNNLPDSISCLKSLR